VINGRNIAKSKDIFHNNKWLMAENLEKKTDNWNLLGKEYKSKCCEGKIAKTIMYDHTGAVMIECECGKKYWHDEGAYKFDQNFDTLQGLKKLLVD